MQYDELGRLNSYRDQEGTLVSLSWNMRDQLVEVAKNGVSVANYDYYPSSTPMRSMKRIQGGKREKLTFIIPIREGMYTRSQMNLG